MPNLLVGIISHQIRNYGKILSREFKGSVNWGYISKYQKLSEDFIREFKDSVDWNHSISKISEIIGRFYPRI